MKRKKPDDVDATRVSTEPEPAAAGPSDTQLFSQVVQDAEENEMNRTTTDGKRGGAGKATNLADVASPAVAAPRSNGASGGGALLYLLAGAIAGAITLVAVTATSAP